MNKRLLYTAVSFLSVAFLLASVISANAAETWDVIAKASPDECFYGVGSDLNAYPMLAPCDSPGQEKTNEAYVWGLTKEDNNIFFGTGPNIHCLVMGSYLGQTNPILTEDYVCELSANPPYGDNRPPGLYMYNEIDGLIRLINPAIKYPNYAA